MRTCAGPSGPGWWYTYPSEKYESQLGLLFPLYGKIKFMFQTTNQVGSITVSPTHSIPIVSPPTCPFCTRSMKNAKKTCPYVLHFFIILGGFCQVWRHRPGFTGQETASVSCLSCSAEQFQSPSNARCTLEPLDSARELLAPVEPQAILHARLRLKDSPAK